MRFPQDPQAERRVPEEGELASQRGSLYGSVDLSVAIQDEAKAQKVMGL